MDVWAPDYEPNNNLLWLQIAFVIGLALVAISVVVVWGLS